jgi:predicted CXXCH cytochrome family protein
VDRAAWLLLALGAIAFGCSHAKPPRRPSPSPLHAHPGDCRQCHASVTGGLPTAPPPSGLCATSGCHKILEPAPRLVHGPVAVGDCRVCHVPHSSVEPHLLAAPAPRLCSTCHEKLYTCPAAGEMATSRCDSCHEPHGGGPSLVRTD